MQPGPIGVFDSGYGGLTVLSELKKKLPNYDYIYLGDNARTPYGTRSFEAVYRFTKECVNHLFDMGCHLIIIACNTASAKALRNIQQHDLPKMPAHRRVLGVIRPTSEIIGKLTQTGHVGILATPGTVRSQSYLIEIERFFPEVNVYQQACPLWVPLIENHELDNPGTDYFVQKYIQAILEQSGHIDTLLLACTHYPLLEENIKKHLTDSVQILSQGELTANSLLDYFKRHPELEVLCSKNRETHFFTTDSAENFDKSAAYFYGSSVQSKHMEI